MSVVSVVRYPFNELKTLHVECRIEYTHGVMDWLCGGVEGTYVGKQVAFEEQWFQYPMFLHVIGTV